MPGCPILKMLPVDVLEDLARNLYQIAARVDGRARALRHIADEEARRQRERTAVQSAVGIALAYHGRGMELPAAVRAAAQLTGEEPGRIEALAGAQLGRSQRATRARRDLEIIRMAARGWTNADIAVIVDLHPKHVARIIRRMRTLW